MKSHDRAGSPGSHPHSDRPNWRKAETFEEYQSNVREGLEEHSERRVAKLLELSRMKLWRSRVMAQIPEPLFNRLIAAGIGSKSLAAIGRALRDGNLLRGEVESCPNCGHQLRVRPAIRQAAIRIVADWLEEQTTHETDAVVASVSPSPATDIGR
jgi:hypothetical protein